MAAAVAVLRRTDYSVIEKVTLFSLPLSAIVEVRGADAACGTKRERIREVLSIDPSGGSSRSSQREIPASSSASDTDRCPARMHWRLVGG